MILKQIYLYPDLTEFPLEFTSVFRDQTRFICNFIGREISAEKFRTKGFKRICIIGANNPSELCFVNSCGVLSVEVALDKYRYQEKSRQELPEYFLDLVQIGIEKTVKQYEIPLHAFNEAMIKFRNTGYKNVWCHSERSIRKLAVKCSLMCELTMDRFVLSLKIERGGHVSSREVLTTPPDEIAFHYRFKEMKIIDESVVILDKSGREVFNVPLIEL